MSMSMEDEVPATINDDEPVSTTEETDDETVGAPHGEDVTQQDRHAEDLSPSAVNTELMVSTEGQINNEDNDGDIAGVEQFALRVPENEIMDSTSLEEGRSATNASDDDSESDSFNSGTEVDLGIGQPESETGHSVQSQQQEVGEDGGGWPFETSHNPSSQPSFTVTWQSQTSGPQRFRTRERNTFSVILSQLLRVITYPITVAMTIVTIVLVLTFCIIPTIIVIFAAMCMYYCFIEDPIPLHLLLRYMFTPEADEMPGNYTTPEQTYACRKLIASKLIIRRLVMVTSYDKDKKKGEGGKGNKNVMTNEDICDGTSYPRKHPFPIRVSTDSKCLHFSEPLEVQEDPEDENGDSAGHHHKQITNVHSAGAGASGGGLMTASGTQIIPHYQRSFDQSTDEQYQQQQQQRQIDSITISASAGDAAQMDIPIEEPYGGHDNVGGNDTENDDDDTNDDNRQRRKYCEEVNESGVTEDGGETSEHSLLPGEFEGQDMDEADDDEDKVDVLPSTSNHHNDITAPSPSIETDYFGIDGDCRDKGTTCDICLLGYEVGDEVAWSPNNDCSHTYHKDCVLDWYVQDPAVLLNYFHRPLVVTVNPVSHINVIFTIYLAYFSSIVMVPRLQRKPTCPICRRDYLKGSKDDNV
jgi:hypothetical protein